MFRKLKNFFRPPAAELVFLKGETVYFKTTEKPTIGQKSNFMAKLPEGQTFGAVFLVQSYENDKQLYTAKIEHPKEAMEYLPKLLGLPFEDRRDQERIDRSIKVLSPQLPGYSAMTRNLSETGICLVTTKPYPQGTILSLQMDLDAAGTHPLRVQVEARWSALDSTDHGAQHLVGGRFLAMTNAQRGQLRHYLNSHKPY